MICDGPLACIAAGLFARDRLLLAVVCLVHNLGATIRPAYAEPPPGTDLASPQHVWFERQHSKAGAWCCNVADGHLLDDKDWRHAAAGYEVRIGGNWELVPNDSLRDPDGGPNDTGHAVVWYRINEYGLKIWCFCPGYEY